MKKMRGKIIAVSPNGEYTNKFGKLITKFKFTFADDKQYTFGFQSPECRYKIGDEIEYEVVNEEYKNAKVIYEKPNNMRQVNFDTNRSILRQVAFKGAIELATSGLIKVDQIKASTDYFYNEILNQ